MNLKFLKPTPNNKVYLYVSIVSLFLNTLSPYFLSYFYLTNSNPVYAQEASSDETGSGAPENGDEVDENDSDSGGDEDSEDSNKENEEAGDDENAKEESQDGDSEKAADEQSGEQADEQIDSEEGDSSDEAAGEQTDETDNSEEATNEQTEDENKDGETADQADEQTEEATDTQEGDILDEGVSDTREESNPEDIEEAKEQVLEAECISDDQTIVEGSEDLWNVNEDEGYAETKDEVQLGVRYKFPLEEKVSVTFTCLPKNGDDRTNLKIEKVRVEDLDLPDSFNTSAEYAYDITTKMDDETFEYDLTLPKPEGVEAGVSYIEKDLDEILNEGLKDEDVKIVEKEDVGQSEEFVEVEDLDHFTVFVVVSPDDTLNENNVKDEDNAWKSDNKYAEFNNKNDWAVYGFPDLGVPAGAVIEGIEVLVEGRTTGRDLDISIWNKSDSSPDSFVGPKEANLNNSEQIIAVGGAADKWGKSWVVSDFDTSFKILVDARSDSGDNGTVYLDQVRVKVYYSTPVTNPPLPAGACGLDIALVLDVSGSINSSELTQMKNAFKGFVDALSGTPTQFSVTEFDTNAQILQSFTADTVAVKAAINSASGGGWTNWEDGLSDAWSTYDPRAGKFNLMVFASDGNPTWSNGPLSHLDDAIAVADTIKTAGTRILGIGIGSDLNVSNMVAITGSSVDTGDITTSDVVTTDFSGLASDLADLASKTCGGTISVNKYIDQVDPNSRGGTGWQFLVSGPNSYSENLDTDSNGQDTSGDLPADSGYSIVESTGPSGYNFGSAVCRNQTGAIEGSTTDNGIHNIDVSDSDIISCDFVNTTAPRTGSISGFKWADLDLQSDKDPGEPLLDGWVIKLHKGDPFDPQLLQQTTTGTGDLSQGQYKFDNLDPGSYYVCEEQVYGWHQMYPYNGVLPYGQGPCHTVNLEAGQDLTDWDFGNYEGGYIKGFKFEDKNGDGVYQDSTESVLEGWEIRLYNNPNDDASYTSYTDENGNYEFGYVNNGDYLVCEKMENGWLQTLPQLEPGKVLNPTIYSSDEGEVCYSVNISSTGQVVQDKNFGNARYGSIESYKFEDKNGDGNWDAGENGLSGWTIKLYASPDSYLTSVQTDENGKYTFDNLIPGYYKVCEEPQGGWVQTAPGGSGCYSEILVESGQAVTQKDFGNQNNPAKIQAQKVVCDAEEYLPDWGNHGAVIGPNTAQDWVNQSGGHCQLELQWQFQWAPAGDYSAYLTDTSFLGAPWTTFTVSEPAEFNDLSNLRENRIEVREVFPDSGASLVGFSGDAGNTAPSYSSEFYCTGDVYNYDNLDWVNNPQYGQTYYCVGFNAIETGNIIGTKYEDVNGSGTRDNLEGTSNTEPGLPGWEITLIDSDENPIGSTTTDDRGDYWFNNLPVGTYGLCETPQKGWVITEPNYGGGCRDVTVTGNQDVRANFGNQREYVRVNVSKSESIDPVFLGETFIYSINWSIESNVSVTNVAVEDSFASGDGASLVDDIWVQANNPGWTQTNPYTYNKNLGNFGPGNHSGTLELKVRVYPNNPNSVALPNNINNYAQLTGTKATDGTSFADTDNESTNVRSASIKVCKMIKDPAGNFVDGSTLPGVDFDLNWSGSEVAMADTGFSTVLNLNSDILKPEGNESECTTYTNLPLGNYYYSEEAISPDASQWEEPLYNDFFNNSLDGFDVYQDLSDPGRNKNADGHIVLSRGRPNRTLAVLNEYEEATIVVHKIVCDYEWDLPNWGDGGPNITKDTAKDWVAKHPKCHLEEGWDFQWSYNEDTFNPEDNTGESTSPVWKTFGPTDVDGMTSVAINDLKGTKSIWLREVWNGDYIPFTYGYTGDNSNDDSAEFYCHTDVLNYDNWDWVGSPEYGETYYCVAWNVLSTAEIQGRKYNDVNANGDFDQWEKDAPGNPYRLNDWTISLYDDEWDWFYSVETGDDTMPGGPVGKGQYRFVGLTAGTYYVCEEPQEGWTQTEPSSGIPYGEGGEDGFCYQVKLNPGQSKAGFQFGNVELTDLHGYKWNDRNGDGERDVCEREPEPNGIFEAAVSFVSELILPGDKENDDNGVCVEEEMLPDWRIFIDEDGNGQWDEGEPFDYTDDEEGDGHDLGWYWFEDLMPGEYRICEELQPNWDQTHPGTAEEPQCYTVNLPNDCNETGENGDLTRAVSQNFVETYCEYNFGNIPEVPVQRLTKENDTGGEIRSIGDLVTYTLTVTASESTVFNAVVTDLPPTGFDYQEGSWTASSSIHGDLAGTISDPVYASPGRWELGNMEAGETITLTYQAKIAESVDAGNYRDLAFAMGENVIGEQFFALAQDPGRVDDTYVGTSVILGVDTPPDEETIEVEEETIVEEVEGDVLGISTLPATGANTLWVYAALSILAVGLFMLLTGLAVRNKKYKKLLGKIFTFVVVAAVGVSVLTAKTYAADVLSVRLEEPETPAKGPFEITFVTMDTGNREITAKCLKKGPGDSDFGQFGSDITIPAGNYGGSDVCEVDAVLDDNGTYKFKVEVTADSSTATSEEVSVKYDKDAPERPKYIEKDRKSKCKYEIEFKTHSEGDTAYVEIYADDDYDIEANEGSKIRTFTIGPDEKKEFTYEINEGDCDERYFAIRAFDEAGNVSDLRVEEVEKVKTKEVEGETKEEVIEEAIALSGGTLGVGGEAGAEGEGTGTEGEEGASAGEGAGAEGEEGDVLGAEDEGGFTLSSLLGNAWFWAIVVLAGGAGYYFVKRRAVA